MPPLELTTEELEALMQTAQVRPALDALVRAEAQNAEARPALRSHSTLRRLFPEQARDLVCPSCNGHLVLKDGRRGLFYGCDNWQDTKCSGSMDADQLSGRPLGTNKNKTAPFAQVAAAIPPREVVSENLIVARRRAKESIKLLTKKGARPKAESQAWLEEKLKVKSLMVDTFDEDTCFALIAIVNEELRPRNRFELIEDPLGD